MPAGRPSKFNAELEENILEQLSSGISLRKICDADGMPDRGTVIRWMAASPEFATKCAHAREMQGESYVDRIIDRVESIEDAEDAHVAKVQIAAWQWTASKLHPKVYGDKMMTSTTSTVVNLNVDADKLKELPQEDLEAAIALGEKLNAALNRG